jgi:hypothetical protein
MKNELIYLRYLTSFNAINDPYFYLQTCRQIENDSLVFSLLNLKVKIRELKSEILGVWK